MEKNGHAENESCWPRVRVGSDNGIPTLYLNDAPWYGMAAERPYLEDHFEVFERMAGIGINHFQCDATCAEDIYHPQLRFWTGPGTYDPAAQDKLLRKLVEIQPDAIFTLRLSVNAPDWWLEAHPGECQVYADGTNERELQRAGRRKLPSLGSSLWREEAAEALTRYIVWLVESGWSKRVCAMFLCNGITWEWGLLGTDGLPDYSTSGESYFRKYLGETYRTDAALSTAWGRTVSISSAKIPSAGRRMEPFGTGGIRPVPDYQDVIDHQQSISAMNADFLLSMAATAKKCSEGKLLIGAFYGYTLTAREQTEFTGTFGPGGFFGGHHELSRVLRSPAIDYLASPFNYADRSLGKGLLLEHSPLASIRLHGKVFWDENDLWAYNNPPIPGHVPSVLSVGYTSSLHETVLMYRRAWASAIVRGKHQWLTELTGWLGTFNENFSDPTLLEEIKRMKNASDGLLMLNREQVTEVAYVVDERSIAYLSADHKEFLSKVYDGTVRWAQLGAPFDILLLDDLLEGDLDYRLVIPGCVKSPEALERFSEWKKKTSGAVLWDGNVSWYPPEDTGILAEAYDSAGVHRYIDRGTAWANGSMLFLHVQEGGKQCIRFRRPVTGCEFFSGIEIESATGEVGWIFEKNGVALFLFSNP